MSTNKVVVNHKPSEALATLKELKSFDRLRSNLLAPYADALENLKQVYIFGAKRLGQKLADSCRKSGIAVLGFIDNNSNIHGMKLNKIPVIPLDSVCEKDIPIIIATTTYLHEISEQLNDAGFSNYIPYPVLSVYDKNWFPAEVTFRSMQEDLIENKHRYLPLYDILADLKSKDAMDEIINFRLTLNSGYLKECADSSEEYFDPDIILLSKNEVFVDGGSYTGDTAKKLIEATGNQYQKIFCFEPDADLLDEAKQNLSDYERINYLNFGLYSIDKTLRFNSTGDDDGYIDPNGDTEIKVIALDNFVEDKITFLKLDVEGAEAEAIKGAAKHIKNENPKMAIALYHKSQDLWQLPGLISSINSNYRFYIRYYSRTSLDIVLYCMPK